MTAATRLVLRGATAVDPKSGVVTPDADVVLEGGAIAAVQPGRSDAGGDVRVVDVTGRYLVPGFEEMHAHPLESDSPGCYELMVAQGISGFRQMSGSLGLLRDRAQGRLPLPDLAPELRQLPGPLMTPINGSTPEQAVAAVAEQAAAGADFIKSGMLIPETFEAAQQEANRLGIPILGHLPPGLDVQRASRIGIRSIEHLGPGLPLLACCSGHEGRLRDAARQRRSPRLPDLRSSFLKHLVERAAAPLLRRIVINPANLTRPDDVRLLAEAVASFTTSDARALAEQFTEDGTWNVPTLIRMKSEYLCQEAEFTENDELRYVSPAALKRWRAANDKFAKLGQETASTLRSVYEQLLELTALFSDAGAPMLAGSDVCGAGWLVPGFALHHEFDELASAGLDPLTVLRMTTSEPGRYLGQSDTVGTLAPGANADIVVLTADPLRSVEHLHRIDGVVRAGRYLDRVELDGILSRVAEERPGF